MRILLQVLVLTFLCSSSSIAEAQTRISTSVMSYNIHLEGSDEEAVPWDERRSLVAQAIRIKKPEILGVQGANFIQIDWLSDQLRDYQVHTPDALDVQLGADVCPIFFDKRKYEELSDGYEMLEGPSGITFLNWMKLKRIDSNLELYVLNTHLDEEMSSDPTYVEGLESRIRSIVGRSTFVFVGDLDKEPDSPFIQGIQAWANDSKRSSLVSISEMDATNVGWRISNTGKRTDYVFLSQDIPANSYEVVDVNYKDQYPSDHLPVFCRLRLEDASDSIEAEKP